MKPEYRPFVDELIELCIREDIGDGDHTSLSCIPAGEHGRMRLLCKQEGTSPASKSPRLVLRPSRSRHALRTDAARRRPRRTRRRGVLRLGTPALAAAGRAHPAEHHAAHERRGDADRRLRRAARGLHTKVLDTRKTTPGMRVLDKMAVKIGGGENHRMGLFDMILLKDNHIDFAGGIRHAICRRAPNTSRPKARTIPIECEVRSLEDIDEVFAAGGVDRIMFDNFTPDMTRRAVEEGRRTLRDRIERRHHARHDARLCRVRRRFHLGRRADAPDQVARHVAQSLRIEDETPAPYAAALLLSAHRTALRGADALPRAFLSLQRRPARSAGVE